MDDLTGRKILIVSAIFPPNILGGAEIIAQKQARWLRDRGAEVAVLTTAGKPEEVLQGEKVDGLRMWRVSMPRPYAYMNHAEASGWVKVIWHLQDHIDPRNGKIMRRVLDAFEPDQVIIHVLQGLGYNSLRQIAKRNLPTVFVLHDLALACIRANMFKKGAECDLQCLPCQISARYKAKLVSDMPRLGYVSPSQALLTRLKSLFSIGGAPSATILNGDSFPVPTRDRSDSPTVRLLYVGRLHSSKGVDILLDAAERVAREHPLHLTILGRGPDEAALRQRFEGKVWCRFAGFVSQAAISDFMMESDLLCVPSLWLENSPGVIYHALSLGLPVLGSDKGGIPELVQDGVTGRLAPAGDREVWTSILSNIVGNPVVLAEWRANAMRDRDRFEQEPNAEAFVRFQNDL